MAQHRPLWQLSAYSRGVVAGIERADGGALSGYSYVAFRVQGAPAADGRRWRPRHLADPMRRGQIRSVAVGA